MPMPKYFKDKIYTPEMRTVVTDYLQKRTDETFLQNITRLKSRYPNKDENFYLNLLEQSKNLLKFDTRKNDVL